MSTHISLVPNAYEQMLREWLMQPKLPPPPDKVVYPLKLFHYPGGYQLGLGQTPVRVACDNRRKSE